MHSCFWSNVGCVAPLPCRPRLCRPNRSYVAPTSELCRPIIKINYNTAPVRLKGLCCETVKRFKIKRMVLGFNK